jgi:hypothetical protein
MSTRDAIERAMNQRLPGRLAARRRAGEDVVRTSD